MSDRLAEARKRIESAESDVVGDFGEAAWNAGAFDVIRAIADDYEPEIRNEILRTELGLFPSDLERSI